MTLHWVLLISMLADVFCDLPTNCSYEDTIGKWVFELGRGKQSNKIDCSISFEVVQTLELELLFPNTAVDRNGNVGTWTMVYNQGFEVVIAGRRYFAFQYYEQTDLETTVSYCNRTFGGYAHDSVVDNIFPPKNWGCYSGHKLISDAEPKVYKEPSTKCFDNGVLYGVDEEFVTKINRHQSLWKAGIYEEYQNMTIAEMIRRSGGSKKLPNMKTSEITPEVEALANSLPKSFDWRHSQMGNMVTPVRNQGSCGSCYAFASMALMESSFKIGAHGIISPIFSPQDVVPCSRYSQGCEGGFPYLIAGKYAQDQGVVTEDCYPYIANDTKTCQPAKPGTPIFVSDYGYVGGFYGACNEALMRIALKKYGPLAIGFQVTDDFVHYKGGIYVSTGLQKTVGFNPFQATNHAVLLVGYGVDNDTGVKYWSVKNSWGTGWGEQGFFRIRRGTDELNIESMAVYAKPYVGGEMCIMEKTSLNLKF